MLELDISGAFDFLVNKSFRCNFMIIINAYNLINATT